MNLSSACIYLKHIVFNCVCGTQKKARAALREELKQYGRRFTPHWQARRANHCQQIRPSGCQPILQYPWWVRREREKERSEGEKSKEKSRVRRGKEQKKVEWIQTLGWGSCCTAHRRTRGYELESKCGGNFKVRCIFLQWRSLNQMWLVNMVEDVFVWQSWMLSGAFFPPRLFL